MKVLTVACVLAVACMLATSLPVSAQVVLEVDPQPAVAGQTLVVRASDAGQPLADVDVTVETRPVSQLAEQRPGGRLSADGTLVIVPQRPGLVRLTLHDPANGGELARHDLAIHAPATPPGALVVLIVAALLLFGGVWVGLAEPS